jgi:hypothetical protein
VFFFPTKSTSDEQAKTFEKETGFLPGFPKS